jgi:predicted ATPase
MKKITINNFRKINNEWDIKLSPVTFFVGTNNSGKSSVLKSLMLLDDYGNSNDHFTLKFNQEHSNNHKIDSYSNAVNRYNSDNKNFDINFCVENNDYLIEYTFTPLESVNNKFEKGKLKKLKFTSISDNSYLLINHLAADEYQLEFNKNFINKSKTNDEIIEDKTSYESIRFETESKIKELSEQLINFEGTTSERISLIAEINNNENVLKRLKVKIKELEQRISKTDGLFQPTFILNNFDDNRTIERVLRKVLSIYFNESDKKSGYSNSKTEMQKVSFMLESISESLKLNVTHLTPNRNSQTRLYVNSMKTNDISKIIAEYFEFPIKTDTEADMFLKHWMEIFDIGIDYRITSIQGLATIIEIKEFNGVEKLKKEEEEKEWINLVDKGFGAGQIFSILLQIATAINKVKPGKTSKTNGVSHNNQILLIEEPEANLHPKLQSKLADLFYQAALTFGLRFIIETHSEYIIRNSQLIHLKQINKENEVLSIYYFDKDNGPYQMKYLDSGKFDKNFGEGFYDEAAKNTMALIQNQRKKD